MSDASVNAVALEAGSLCVRIGGRLIVDDVGLAVKRGSLTVLVGPNGAGKTTLIRALAGLIPCEGDVRIDGRTARTMNPRERARLIAYLPQGHVFNWPLAAAEIVALGRHPHADPFSPPSEADRQAVMRAIAATGIEAFAARSILSLSGGERARVALARALATEAPILLADEPTAALDPRHQLIVMEQLRAVAHSGAAVLAVMHDLMLAARFADRVLVMDEGRIAVDAAPADALSPETIARVFGVDASVIDIDGERAPILRAPLQQPD
ncbi:MAG: ABC transporter ATP-binding protein [Variibacter sp.]